MVRFLLREESIGIVIGSKSVRRQPQNGETTPAVQAREQSNSLLKEVCHWLCQCYLKSASARNSALAEPVAHDELGYVTFFIALPVATPFEIRSDAVLSDEKTRR
jgi:hypothetical protein